MLMSGSGFVSSMVLIVHGAWHAQHPVRNEAFYAVCHAQDGDIGVALSAPGESALHLQVLQQLQCACCLLCT
jgi:hypothetical protein